MINVQSYDYTTIIHSFVRYSLHILLPNHRNFFGFLRFLNVYYNFYKLVVLTFRNRNDGYKRNFFIYTLGKGGNSLRFGIGTALIDLPVYQFTVNGVMADTGKDDPEIMVDDVFVDVVEEEEEEDGMAAEEEEEEKEEMILLVDTLEIDLTVFVAVVLNRCIRKEAMGRVGYENKPQ